MDLGTPFGLTIDFTFWEQIFSLPTNQLVGALVAIIGWVFIALVFFFMATELWLGTRSGKFTSTWKWLVLAVDVPMEEVQTPKAVEQIFAQLSGALTKPNFVEKYWKGVKPKWFSFEIISIEGYIQFLIYTEEQYRDLVEASIYAQFPMAEITEVEDYVQAVPDRFPNPDYDIAGIEFGLAADDAYPIRTYEDFEHTVTKDFQFNDPMAAILENFTRIGSGENLWFEIIIEPVSDEWKEKGVKLIKSIIEQKKPSAAPNPAAQMLNWAGDLAMDFVKHATVGMGEAAAKKPEKKEEAKKISDLTPRLKDTVAAVEDKISKIGFKAKARILYAAKKDVFNPSKCLQGFVGAINQFKIVGRNAIVPKGGTSVPYPPFKDYRTNELKRKFVSAYKKRKIKVGKNPFILNIEELATLWHFPLPLVKTPLLQKTAVKRAEPPTNLPVETFETPLHKIGAEPPKETEIIPPEDLPYG